MPNLKVALAVAEAVKGAVEIVLGVAKEGEGEGGFHIEADKASYPKELQGFLDEGSLVNREVLKFKADGYVWDTDLGIGMRGSFSDNNDELMCFEDLPGIASNRFMTDVTFYESAHSDTVSRSLLKITVRAIDRPEDPPESPSLVFFVSGRFDPVGIGDERFSFYLHVDTYGGVRTTEPDCSSGLRLTDAGDHIEIYLNQ
jgi:hypothetical protein